jgi:PAS domain S-box-containing protein
MDTLKAVLEYIVGLLGEEPPAIPTQRQFVPTRDVTARDHVILDMLNSAGHEQVSFCICDPAQTDCPIIFASDGFCHFTGYAADEIEGRNCRFLQGPETTKADVEGIRSAIRDEREASVNLVNYRKDGSQFVNQFFLSPLYDTHGKLVYFIGVQCSVAKLGGGQGKCQATLPIMVALLSRWWWCRGSHGGTCVCAATRWVGPAGKSHTLCYVGHQPRRILDGSIHKDCTHKEHSRKENNGLERRRASVSLAVAVSIQW